MKRKKITRKKLSKIVLEYGIHVWVIFFVANILLFYSLHFFTRAQSPDCMTTQQVANDNRCLYIFKGQVYQSTTQDKSTGGAPCGTDLSTYVNDSLLQQTIGGSQLPPPIAAVCATTPSPSADISKFASPSDYNPPSPTPTPAGPVLDISFSLPGIGSGSGNFNPVHKERDTIIEFYTKDVNPDEAHVKPVYSTSAKFTYNTDSFSSTYTSFVNHFIDLNAAIPEGKYQIAIRTDQTLRHVFKNNPTDPAGEIIDLSSVGINSLDHQTLTPGDIYPVGKNDNVMDINDYNTLVNCFGEKANTPSCPDNRIADLNDDGVVDGVDYNLMVLSFQTLLNLGYRVPTISVVPTSPLTTQIPLKSISSKKATASSVPASSSAGANDKTVTAGSESSPIGGILFLIFLLLLLGGVIGMYLLNKKFKAKIDGLLHKSPVAPQPNPPTEPGAAESTVPPAETPGSEQTTVQTGQPEATAASPKEVPTPSVQSPQATPTDIAANTEIPITQLPNQSPTTAQPPANNSIDADYYVKKKSIDEQNKAFWLSLTGDNGAVEGYYKATDVTEGFAHIKGTMKNENGKSYIEISELTPAAS